MGKGSPPKTPTPPPPVKLNSADTQAAVEDIRRKRKGQMDYANTILAAPPAGKTTLG